MQPYQETFQSKGQAFTIRTPRVEDAAALIAYMEVIDQETTFLSREPGEFAQNVTLEKEQAYLRSCLEDEGQLFLIVEDEASELLPSGGLAAKAGEATARASAAGKEGIQKAGKAAGKAVDALSREAAHRDSFRVKVHDASFSFSGLENKMNALAQQGTSPADICWFVLASIIQGVETATRQALEQYPGLPVLCAGGVASNQLMRERMTQHCGAVFAETRYSTDNAMGTAILTWRAHHLERK